MRSLGIHFLGLVLVLNTPLLIAEQSVNESKRTESPKLTLESIMADPDWMGNSPKRPSWSLDGEVVYFSQKENGHSHLNNFSINLSNQKTKELDSDNEYLLHASSHGDTNPSGTHGVFTYQDNLYLLNIQNKSIEAITANDEKHTNPRFINETTISYQINYQVFSYDTATKLSSLVVDFKLEEDPNELSVESYLEQSQPRLLDIVDQRKREAEYQKERTLKQKIRKTKLWYLGQDIVIRTFKLSPDAKWLILGTTKKELSGKADHMPEFVTEDGYVKNREVRSLVGSVKPLNETFYLFNLHNETKHSLDLSQLPGINDDPLKEFRKRAAQKIGYKYQENEGNRAVYAHQWTKNGGVEWTSDSHQAAIQLFSFDNKTRWLVTIDPSKKKISTAHWMTDSAWINDSSFNDFGWLPDNNTLYYLSEEDGYSHLYIKNGKRKPSQLTQGKFEVSDLTISKSGHIIYYRANETHPGNYEVYALDLQKRTRMAVSKMGGLNTYQLSPDEKNLLITHSTTTKMPELYWQKLASEQPAIKITDTMSSLYKKHIWQSPQIVPVKSSEVEDPIYSRLYVPQAKKTKASKKRPAVVFVHGAGYTQNSHQGWSYYFREFMFHNYLTEKGFVVLDMDYRASKGYGRDWRTAIYRNMGTPELQDLKDGAKWLVDNMNVDPDRIGVYGGSYGGFMTFMAMFKEPELFAAGAALRPVTDWSHYNHGYTSNILNTPQVDPDAYERSSPIEFAVGLKKPMLICHGMVDDNVFFKDTVRLVQKLIELKKTNYFETAIYPVEPHGFKEASSWLDEYTRIDNLFERTLR